MIWITARIKQAFSEEDGGGGAQVAQQSVMSSRSEQVQWDLVGLGCCFTLGVSHTCLATWSQRSWTTQVSLLRSAPAHAY